jgi:hypothetical protein
MSSFGIPGQEIARVLGIDPSTMRKYFTEDLATGHVEANAKVAQALFKKATSDGRGSVIVCMFWLECRAVGATKSTTSAKRKLPWLPLPRLALTATGAKTWSTSGIRCNDGLGWLTGAAIAKPLVLPCIGWRRRTGGVTSIRLVPVTAKLNVMVPRAWLADVLARIADHPVSGPHVLLPWNWKRDQVKDAGAA